MNDREVKISEEILKVVKFTTQALIILWVVIIMSVFGIVAPVVFVGKLFGIMP